MLLLRSVLLLPFLQLLCYSGALTADIRQNNHFNPCQLRHLRLTDDVSRVTRAASNHVTNRFVDATKDILDQIQLQRRLLDHDISLFLLDIQTSRPNDAEGDARRVMNFDASEDSILDLIVRLFKIHGENLFLRGLTPLNLTISMQACAKASYAQSCSAIHEQRLRPSLKKFEPVFKVLKSVASTLNSLQTLLLDRKRRYRFESCARLLARSFFCTPTCFALTAKRDENDDDVGNDDVVNGDVINNDVNGDDVINSDVIVDDVINNDVNSDDVINDANGPRSRGEAVVRTLRRPNRSSLILNSSSSSCDQSPDRVRPLCRSHCIDVLDFCESPIEDLTALRALGDRLGLVKERFTVSKMEALGGNVIAEAVKGAVVLRAKCIDKALRDCSRKNSPPYQTSMPASSTSVSVLNLPIARRISALRDLVTSYIDRVTSFGSVTCADVTMMTSEDEDTCWTAGKIDSAKTISGIAEDPQVERLKRIEEDLEVLQQHQQLTSISEVAAAADDTMEDLEQSGDRWGSGSGSGGYEDDDVNFFMETYPPSTHHSPNSTTTAQQQSQQSLTTKNSTTTTSTIDPQTTKAQRYSASMPVQSLTSALPDLPPKSNMTTLVRTPDDLPSGQTRLIWPATTRGSTATSKTGFSRHSTDAKESGRRMMDEGTRREDESWNYLNVISGVERIGFRYFFCSMTFFVFWLNLIFRRLFKF